MFYSESGIALHEIETAKSYIINNEYREEISSN